MGTDHLYERIDAPFSFYRIKVLDATADELLELSQERNLALSARKWGCPGLFRLRGAQPHGCRAEATAQAWSEHCSPSPVGPSSSRASSESRPQNLLVIQRTRAW